MPDKFPFKLKYHHVGIFISNMDRSIAWYDEMLGYKLALRRMFDLPGQGPVEMAWVKHGDHYIELYEYRKELRPFSVEDYLGSLGTKHLCLYVEDSDLAPLTRHLESKDVEFWVKHHWPEEATDKPNGVGVIYIKDPDGILIEIQQSYTPGEY
ncbi:MAG: VOC family protein [Syntrophobacteraceae bacterium]|nr:VOC family protein [Syntrophobacteraceae bacterium]